MRAFAPLLIAGLLVASPAGAQVHAPRDPAPAPALPGIQRELGDLRDDIGDGKRGGQLSRAEAKALRREASQIGRMADRYSADGLSEPEQKELEFRAGALRGLSNAQRIGRPE